MRKNDDYYGSALGPLFENIRRISRCVRKENREAIREFVPVFYSCLMAAWDRLGVNIAEALWLKYPGVCPYCLKTEKCACIIAEKSAYIWNDAKFDSLRNAAEKRPANTAEWQAMFKRIYGNVNSIEPLTAIWLHFIEEFCELTDELERENAERILEESADVTAWFFSFCTKLNIIVHAEV